MDRYIYVVGEQQDAVLPELDQIYDFTGEQMGAIETVELATVLTNVFGQGQFFPGPQEALTAVVHEFIRRSEDADKVRAGTGRAQCALVTVFKRFDGQFSVENRAVLAAEPERLDLENPDSFHALLLESVPALQQVFTAHAYAVDSRIVAIVKEATMHHIHRGLD